VANRAPQLSSVSALACSPTARRARTSSSTSGRVTQAIAPSLTRSAVPVPQRRTPSDLTRVADFTLHPWPPEIAPSQQAQYSVAHHADDRSHVRLSRREQEVLSLLRYRLTDPEIADLLSISTRTVESHVRRILGKLHARNRREAAALAGGQALL
jgi:DNA-binding NarL/FixJ family response regulator